MEDVATLKQETAHRVERLKEQIAAACHKAGRAERDVTLVAVTKTFPASRVEAAMDAGITHFGENRVQELEEKAAWIPGKIGGGAVNWHLVGTLQRNKVKKVLEIADYFHALDSLRLARELEKRSAAAGRVIPTFLQVNVSGEASKGGFAPGEVVSALREITEQCAHVNVIGLMTIASFVDDPEDVREEFRLLRRLRDACTDASQRLLTDGCLSMGMSNDFEVAIEEGATHIRIGSAIFGARE